MDPVCEALRRASGGRVIYSLYVDESGNYANPHSVNLLGGALLRGPPTRAREQRMRAALLNEFPGLPWPLHASEIVLPLAPIGWSLAGHPLRDPDLGPPVIDRALRALEGAPGLHDFRAQWRAGGRASFDLIGRTRQLFRVVQAADLATAVALQRAALDRRTRLVERARTIALGVWSGAAFVGAVSPSLRARGPAKNGSSTRHPDRARWLSALRATTERASLLLGPGDQLLVVISRYAGLKDRKTLRATAVDLASAGATLLTRTASASDPMAGNVIADLLLYPARQHLKEAARAQWSFGAFDGNLRDRLLPVTFQTHLASAPLSTLLVDDRGRELVQARKQGRPLDTLVSDLPELRPRWNREQTHAWLEAL